MNKSQHKHPLLFPFIFAALLTACRLNPADGLNWKTDLLVPIANAELRLENVLQDSILSNSGNKYAIVYRDTLAEAVLDEMVEFPDTNFVVSVKLDTLTLDADTVSEIITLGQVARQLVDDGNIIGQIILNNHNKTIPGFPAIPGLSAGPINIDASDFFEFAKLKQGELVLTIQNRFPVDIENVQIEIANASEVNDPFVMDYFPIIPSGEDTTTYYDLAGKEIESQLVGELSNLDVASKGGGVPIDTNDYIRVILVAQNLKATEARAVFPAQTIIDTVREQEYAFKGEFEDIQLTKAIVKAGKLRAEAISTVQDSIQFQYYLASAMNDNGQVPGLSLKLDPAPEGGVSTLIREVPLDGFTLDLTARGTTVNTMLDSLKVNLLESGNLVTLDQNDSVMVTFGLVDMVPTYVEGYIGQQEFRFSGKAALNIFSELNIEKLHFATPKTTLTFANSIGVAAEVDIFELSGKNSTTGKQTALTGKDLLAGPVKINYPGLDNPTETVNTALSFQPDNSNITHFLDLLIDQVSYDIRVRTNPAGNDGSFQNFGSDQSRLAAFVDFELPLEGSFEHFVLADTSELTPGKADLEEITAGTLRLVLENQFPMSGIVHAVVYNEGWQEIAVLANNHPLEAGLIDAERYVTQLGTTVIEKVYDQALIEEILEKGKYLVLRFDLSSSPSDEDIILFTDYRVKAHLVAQFDYSVSN